MPCGLQCWDATGKLVVDIGDYNTRYLGRTSVMIPANVNMISGSFGGLTAAGSFAVVVSASSNFNNNNFATRTYDGGYRVWKLFQSATAVTLTLDLYAFI